MPNSESHASLIDNQIYDYACDFYVASRKLFPTEQDQSTVTAYFINTCLSLELFLKSINVTRVYDTPVSNRAPIGLSIKQQNEENTPLIIAMPPYRYTRLQRRHELSFLFENLNPEHQKEINAKCGLNLAIDPQPYDKAFVTWRYGYETPWICRSSRVLEKALHSVKLFCDKHL